MTEQNLTKLTINTLTKSQYQALYNSGDISYTEIYLITDDNGTGVYALANNVYTKAEIDDIIANLPSGGGSGSGVDLSDYYTKSEITALLANKANTSDLSDYVEIADLANVATSGDYNDLFNAPTIPSKTSDLTNDSGYVSSSSLSTVATSGSYNDLSNKPDLTVYETKAEAFSGDYDDLTNKPNLSIYQTVSNAFSGDYDDLTNKPDLTVYQTIVNSFSGDYDDLSNKPDLSVYQTIANAFSGSYNDLTDKPTIPTIPTNISTFTNDSGYQTASNVNTAIATALTGYATESYVQTAVQNLGNVFTIKGSVSTVANLPSTNNSIGDVYYVAEKQAGYIWIEIDNVAQWEELGETIDLSNYVQSSDLTWNNISSKPTFATVATSGSYNDLTDKPTIPAALSGGTWINIDSNNNINVSDPYISLVDGSGNPRVMISSTSNGTAPTFTATYCNITPTGFGIVDKTQGTFGGYTAAYTYYRHRNILVNNKWTLSFPTDNGTIATQEWVSNNFSSSGSSSAPSNMATTDTAQTISAEKTFTSGAIFDGSNGYKFIFNGTNPIEMYAPSNSTTGFTLFNSNNYEKGYLQYNSIQDALYLGRWGDSSSSPTYAQNIGFLSELGSNGYRVLMPNKTSTSSATATANTYYIPTEITNGTTVVKAASNGIIDISSLLSSGGTTVSGTNDGTNWTSITIGSNTYNIPSGSSSGGSTSGDYVTLATDQNITGTKTFTGAKKLGFKQSSSSDVIGFTAYDYNNAEFGNLQIANRTVGGSNYTYVTLGNYSSNSTKSKLGFRVQPNSSSNSFNFVMPYGTNSNFTANGYSTSSDTTFPFAFTDGTTTIKANATGLVDLSTLNLGGSSSGSGTTYSEGYGIDISNGEIAIDTSIVALKSDLSSGGSSVSGTNDGTNWTSLTINGSTYAIPAGGSSSGGSSGSSAGNGAIYYHNVRLAFAGSNSNYGKTIEFSILTKSATQILTMAELINQVSALQNEPYNDSVVGVIFGQVYQTNTSGTKEQILGFGLTGTSSNPNFYMNVRSNNGRQSAVTISLTNAQSFTSSINWINNLQNLSGYEVSANCYDIVTGGASSSSGSGIVDINDIPLVEGELAVKEIPLYDETTGEPLLDENGNPITEERLGIDDNIYNDLDELYQRVYTLEQNSGGNVPTKTSDLINDSGFITSASVPSTATSTSTSTVTPSTIQLTFTFEDDTTQTVTLMTGATVSTTTTTTLS